MSLVWSRLEFFFLQPCVEVFVFGTKNGIQLWTERHDVSLRYLAQCTSDPVTTFLFFGILTNIIGSCSCLSVLSAPVCAPFSVQTAPPAQHVNVDTTNTNTRICRKFLKSSKCANESPLNSGATNFVS